MPSARWHISHFSWKIGAMSLANVTSDRFCACAGPALEDAPGSYVKLRASE
jgi:hypothetical protein